MATVEAPTTGRLTAVPDGWKARAQSLLDRADAAADDAWVLVADIPSALCPEQFWHAMHAWTSRRSFLHSIWGIDSVEGPEALVPVSGAGSSGAMLRSWSLRRLQRKTPVTMGLDGCYGAGSATDLEGCVPTVDLLEFAVHEVDTAGGDVSTARLCRAATARVQHALDALEFTLYAACACALDSRSSAWYLV
jgi:hypothetical protein